MTFVCTSAFAYRVEGFEAAPTGRYIISVGHDDELRAVYKVMVGLDVLPGGDLELFFCLTEAIEGEPEERLYWSGRDTGFIRSPADRAAILESVCTAVRDMLVDMQLEAIVWFTHDEAMPERALLKFDSVREAVEAAGMVVEVEALPAGRRLWRAHRPEATS